MKRVEYRLLPVTEFVIVPGDELDELIVKSNTGSSIEDGRLLIANK